MEYTYGVFEIKITSPKASTYTVEARYADRQPEGFTLAKNSLEIKGDEIPEAKKWLEKGAIDKDYSIDFGKRLFQSFFRGEVLKLYEEALGDLEPNSILIIALDFPVPDDLAEIPWELMYDSKGGKGFLARSAQTPFVRHYPKLPKPNKPPDSPPLRVLLITASPKNKRPISGRREAKNIDQSLTKMQLGVLDVLKLTYNHLLKTWSFKELGQRLFRRSLVETEALHHATYEKIQEKIASANKAGKPFHIIHFIGHTEGTSVCLEPKPGGKKPDTPADEFAELISSSTLNLVVLNACSTASGTISNISRAILDKKVPAVVGMQIKVMDETAVSFAREFYRIWATGEPLTSALVHARRLMTTLSPKSVSDWSVPVLSVGPIASTAGMKLDFNISPITTGMVVKGLWRLMATFAALIVMIGALFIAGPYVNKQLRTQVPVIKCIYPYPMAEGISFNVAVAPFTVFSDKNSAAKDSDGVILAQDIYKRLDADIEGLGMPGSYELRGPDITCPIIGNTPELRWQSARELAKQIHADVIIYGVIQPSGDEGDINLEFYVDYRGFEHGEEITGEYLLGKSLPMNFPLDEVEMQEGIYKQYTTREKALIQIVLGLSNIAVDNFDKAMQQFQMADDLPDWYDNQGKSILYVLMGGTSLGKATHIRDITPEERMNNLETARFYYEEALKIDDQFARAQVGLANVVYQEALGDLSGGGYQIAVDKLGEAKAAYEKALSMSNAPESANIPSKVHFGYGQIHLAQLQYALSESEFLQVVEHFEAGDDSLENSATHAYASLGWIARQRKDYPAAIELIEKAVDHASPYYRVRYLVLLGDTYSESGNLASACDAYQSAQGWAENIGDQRTIHELQDAINRRCDK